jgi:hypothetical protein
MEFAFQSVFYLSVPRCRAMGLRPEIFDRNGAAEFEWNQVINLVIAGAVGCDAVFPVDFAFHFRRNIAHLSAVSGYTDILHRNVECIPGVRFESGRIGVGCWARTTWAKTSKNATARMNIGESLTPAVRAQEVLTNNACHLNPRASPLLSELLFVGRVLFADYLPVDHLFVSRRL